VKYQQSSEPLIPRAPFQRLVKTVTQDLCPEHPKKYTLEALHVLQLAVEDYLTGLLEDAYLCTLHSKRVTMFPKDLMLARRIRGVNDPGNR
jgi:histone H3